MLLTIYDRNSQVRAEVAANDSSTQQKEIQGDNVLTLSFTYYECIPLDVNDYTVFEGERYWLTEKYAPKQRSGSEWSYDLKLYGVESLIKRFLVLETTDGDEEPVFTLTATPREHVAMVVKCINDGMGHTTDWKVGRVDGTALITIDYEGKFCDAALKEIAEKVGGQAEWWAEGQTLNVCRCEYGEEITLGYGKGLTELERDTSNTEGFYTRLFPIGSTRNIDPERYGHSRLMLPGGRKHVELHTEEYGIYDRYEKDAFSGIFPRRTGTVSSVRSEDTTDENGNAFTIYHFKDESLNFDPNEYELAGETKRVSFQDGDLEGLGTGDDHYFEVNYDSKTREFEIITIWPYDNDIQLPGGKLVPRVGDHYILWNIRMPDEYYPAAEAEFQEVVDKFNEEHWQDISVYKAPTDHVWVEENHADLYVGRRVRLESEKYFPETGYRSSRITKITRKVNLPSQMDIEISDALQTGTLEKVNDNFADLKDYTKNKIESLSLPDIIRSGDNTLPTDNNIFSARRSKKEFLSKKEPDRTPYPFSVGDLLTAEKGTQFGKVFVPGIAGGIGGNIDGEGNGELESLIVRKFAEFTEYRCNRVSINVGNQWRAPGGGVIEEVIPDTDLDGNLLPSGTIVLHLEDGEIGAVDVDDICQGIFHDSATTGNNSNNNFDDGIGNFRFAGFFSSYFRITELIDTDSKNSRFRYTLRNDDKWAALFHPCALMTFVSYGNFTKKDRQSSRYSTLTYERYLQDVNDWTFTQYNIAAQFGDLSNLKVFGLDMTGYSAYLDNVYFSGTIQQIEKAPLRMEIENPGGGILASGESTVINCRVLKGFDYVADDDITWEILRDTGDADADAAWTQKQKVKDFAGSITLSHTSTDDDLSTNPLVKGTLFTFVAHSKNGSTVRASIILRPPEEGEKGEDAILVSISQSGIIRNGQGNIILYASVFKGGDDITDKYIPEQFSWIRDSGSADFDAGWNRLHKDYGNTVALTAEDVRGSAVFSCELESE